MQRPSAIAPSGGNNLAKAEADSAPTAEQTAVTQQLAPPSLDETLTQSPTSPSGDRPSAAMSPAASPDAGSIPGYELLGEIARGGMGIVFRARQLGLNRIVAIKMIRGGQLADSEDLARFQAEAEAIARLRHPHIVTIYEVGWAGPRGEHPFFSMEYVAGRSLLTAAQQRTFTSREAAELTAKIARAVQYAHEHGVLHRDLKPSNVLLDEQGEPHVTDFGLAKRIDDDSGLTMTGSIVGTPCYMAPEQALGRASQAGPSADIYSLGAMLYELLTGRPPFRGESVVETLRQVTDDDPVPPSRLSPRIPPDVETICLKCLQKDQRRRYATAADLADDLARFLAGEPVAARPVGRLERLVKWCRRRPAYAGLAAALLIAAASLAIVWGVYQVRLIKANADLKVAVTTARENYADMRLHYYTLQINDAARLWNDSHPNVERARDLLASLEPKPGEEELRRFEWHHLWHLCTQNAPTLGRPAGRGTRKLHLLQYLDDGRLATFWTEVSQGELELYSGTQRTGHKAVGQRVDLAALTQDGRHLAIGSRAAISLYDVSAAPRLIRNWTAHDGSVTALAFSKSGELLASAAADSRVRVWQVNADEPIAEHQVQVLPDARLVVTDQGAVLTEALAGGVQLLSSPPSAPFTGHLERGEFHADFLLSPDERKLIVLIPGEFQIRVWDLATRKRTTYELGTQRMQPVSGGLSHDGGHLAFGANNMCAVLNLQTRQLRTFKGHVDDPQHVALAPDMKSAASADRAGHIKLWDLTADQQGCLARPGPGSVAFLDHSPDGRRVVYGGYGALAEQGYGIVADANTGLPLAQWQCEHYPTRGEFSPSGEQLVIVIADRRGEGPSSVELRSAVDGQLVKKVALAGTTLWDATFLDEQSLLLACEDGRLVKWHLGQGRELVGVATGDPSRAGHPVKRVVVLPSQRVAATLNLDGQLRIWDAATLAPVAESAPVLATDEILALAPHRPWIARVAADAPESPPLHSGIASIEERSLTLVDYRANREVHRLGGHKDMITAAAFNADGSRLATGDSNGNVIVWDTITGHELLTFPAHINQVMALSFAPDDRSLATGGSDLVLRIWQGSKERLGVRD